ncbi:hypothetical protein M378DRAFT_12418 [Amanita muscaria Koide BX008]|uniref:F-box domain-containing protein n=1 Tax=Amanita muscaria (strain Koide BX008) TaxID=946122 RepID=A0A0C2T8U6_AMAMK|nr:hypothetical protein M378DRAFT_12418 [Amanita muscaria Koide BX008]
MDVTPATPDPLAAMFQNAIDKAGNAPLPSVALPRELVEQILLLLDTKSVLTCRLVNREFNETIQSSTLLQYFLACKAAGVVDNPQSPLSYAERLEALKKREDAWRKLSPVFEMTFGVKHQTASQICRSTEGVYFLTDDNRKDLHYCHLTSFCQDSAQWIRMPGHGPALNWSGILVNFTTALYEHDLIVNFMIISTLSTWSFSSFQQESITLSLAILKSMFRDHLKLILGFLPELSAIISLWSSTTTMACFPTNYSYLTGNLNRPQATTEDAYTDLDFVSSELLLVPNEVLSHFKVWHLPPQQINPTPPIQILSLQIPVVSPEYSLCNFRCYGEPNPALHSMPYLPPRPFFSSPENSIIMVTLKMSSNSGRDASYNLIVHRSALLDTIQTWTSPSLLEQQEYLPMWSTNEVTVHQIADPEDGSVELYAQSDSQTSLTFPTSHISAFSGSSSVFSGLSANLSTSQCTFLQVPWAKWGPPISRWFQVNDTHTRWLSHSNGQRYVFSDPDPLDGLKLMVNVVDFNPHNFRMNAEMMAHLRSGEGENDGNKLEGNEEETLRHKGVFLEEVYMGLNCVVYRAPDEYDSDLVLMDEQRLLGLKLNGEGWIESVKILYIG